MDPSVYDEMYLHDDRTYDDPVRSPYYPVFEAVVAEARRLKSSKVLEVGCGSGTLGKMLIDAGMGYRGFDLAKEGVRKAALRAVGAAELFVADATDPTTYLRDYDAIVCLEVLEHIDADLDVVGNWKPGCRVICSVPNFDYATHVRKFAREREVIERYGELIRIDRIIRIRKKIWSHDLTVRDYLRRLRWSREEPRRFAGLLGIRQFDWHGGWFLFSGERTNLR
jgi:SAM-dependent methyltransferase